MPGDLLPVGSWRLGCGVEGVRQGRRRQRRQQRQRHASSNTRNSLIASERAHIAVEGLEDVAIIASEDAIYVGRLSDAQRVGPMVKAFRANPATQVSPRSIAPPTVPWGGYSSVLNGDRFQVKRLFVKPGKKLSLQKHHHRAEHWVVVSGTAEVTVDGKVTMLTENRVHLPAALAACTRLANPGKILLELIEVQTGSYLGEDDIIRIEDEFGVPPGRALEA